MPSNKNNGNILQDKIGVKKDHVVFEWPHCSAATEELRFVVRRAKKVPDL